MCVMFVHVLYRSLKLLSTHLKCIGKQKIHINDYKTSHPDVLNNIWQTPLWQSKQNFNQLLTDQAPRHVNRISKTVVGVSYKRVQYS